MLATKCDRCDKEDVDIHTCSPTIMWRKAMQEGIQLVFEVLESYEFEFDRCTNTDQICQVVEKGIKAELADYLGK